MTRDDCYSVQELLQKMDAGDFDGNLQSEIKKLSKEHVEELAQILLARAHRRE
jgi:hypothetical protein